MKNQKGVWFSQWNGPVAIIGVIAILVILLLPAVQQVGIRGGNSGLKARLQCNHLAGTDDCIRELAKNEQAWPPYHAQK